MPDSTLIKSAHIAATVTAAAASGGIIGISVFTIPAIALPSRHATAQDRARETPGPAVSHVARQWSFVYNTGKVVFPSMAAASALLYSYVAYAVRGPGGSRARCMSNLYLTAAGLVVMIAPITGVLVFPVNKKIEPYIERDDKLAVEGQQDEEFPGLLRKWAQVNAIRGLFPAMGAVLGAAVGFGLI